MYPLLYHAHHNLHQEDIPFWLQIADERNGDILELGCGTGRVTIPLAQAGYKVYGLDNDLDMLMTLKDILPTPLHPQVNLILGDMTHFHIATKFSTILLPCNTLSTFPVNDQRNTIACVYHHLEMEGVFAVSLPNFELLASLPPRGESEIEETFSHPADGEPVQVSSEWFSEEDTFTFTWHYDHLIPDGNVTRTTVQTQHYLVPNQAYTVFLREAGFSKISIYGNYDLSPFSAKSPYLILLARK